MIDQELVDRKLLLITKDLEGLAALARLELDAFLANAANQVLAERYLERLVGRMIDVNFHLLTETGHPPPADYYQSFLELCPAGVYDAEFSRRVATCAGLRNRIAHEYDDLDPAKLHEATRAALVDVPRYIRHVIDWLSQHHGVDPSGDH
jgi:uncharacterized protein YutE (UPF0331/DUF86 family)